MNKAIPQYHSFTSYGVKLNLSLLLSLLLGLLLGREFLDGLSLRKV